MTMRPAGCYLPRHQAEPSRRKMLPLTVGDHRALCDAARLSLPNSGPAVRLFRGAGAFERRRGIYGPSWSADAAAAELEV
jgi:hypothetical protein